MNTTLRSTPKDVFLQLLSMILLYLSAIFFMTIVWQYINYSFPDNLESYYQENVFDTIRWASASLIVFFPVFLITSWAIGKDFIAVPDKRNLGFRKWLIYITLLVASITITTDLVWLIYDFYQGELTLKFTLKALTILLVTGGIFGYLLWDVNTHEYKKDANKMLAISSLFLMVVTIVAGFFIVGSPWEQRKIRFDQQRVNDLQNIQYEIINYWRNKNQLPKNLDALKNSISGYVPPVDPENESPYEYTVKGKLQFELCANFVTTSRGSKDGTPTRVPVDFYGATSSNWFHEAGRTCFDRTIDPDFQGKQ